MEDKEAIIKAAEKTLRCTTVGRDILDSEYFIDGCIDYAILYLVNRQSGKITPIRANITADSGLEIIKDMIYALERKEDYEVQNMPTLRSASRLW